MNKNIWTLLITSVLLLGLIGMVNASPGDTPTCSWRLNSSASPLSPTAAGSTISSSAQQFDVKWDHDCNDGGVDCNITKVAFEYRIAGGTWKVLQNHTVGHLGTNVTNTSIKNTTWAKDIAGTGFCFDSKLYDVRATFYNGSGGQPCTVSSLTNLICDNTKPKCQIMRPASSTTYEPGLIAIGNTGNASQRCQWTFGVNGNIYSGTINGSTAGREDCYYDFPSGQPADAIYEKITLTVSDRSGNTSTCTVSNVKVEEDESNVKQALVASQMQGATTVQTEQQKAATNLALAVIIIGGAVLLFNKKKK